MKKFSRVFFKIIKWLFIILVTVIVLFLIVRFIGQKIYARTPKGGINEEMYVDINGTKQWISIYGQDMDNPVLLYLHGGPGSSTSAYDYAFTRKWSDVYTVVTWDQRNCGKSYSSDQNDTILTYDLMMSDGVEMTRFLLDYLDKVEKLDVDDFSMEYFAARNALMEKYCYHMLVDGTDYNLIAAQIFNPYYSLGDFYNYINSDYSVYEKFSDIIHEIAQAENGN